MKTTSNAGSSASLENDTARIRSDVNQIVNSIGSNQPDTEKLKSAAQDILSKGVSILSDSGINKLAGKDPSAQQAADMVKKIRDATGLTPVALDSMKKAISGLSQ